MSDLEKLRFNLEENRYAYFTEHELQSLLDVYGSVREASYHGCIRKAYDDSINVGGITTLSNKEYWLRRAYEFKRKNKKYIKRSDEVL